MIGKYIGYDTVQSGIFLFMASKSLFVVVVALFFSTEFLSRSLDGGRALWLEKTGQHNIHSIILHRRGWREDSWKILYWDERESDEKKENIFQEVTHGKKDKSHISCRAINLRLREFLIISDNAFFFFFGSRWCETAKAENPLNYVRLRRIAYIKSLSVASPQSNGTKMHLLSA